MNGEHLQDELIDLGAASEATKGGAIGNFDVEGTLRPFYGLCED
jgi:hypothetical protein